MSEWLPFDESDASRDSAEAFPDEEARRRAVDPAHNVVLEASAGTGKTHVLVDRYLNLLSRGVEPANILAITFTRKAAAEMRGRILDELRRRSETSGAETILWRDLRDRSGEVAISTIDAFCLSLLREFPLEADLDPGFDLADETQVPRLMEEALDRALDIGRGLSRTDDFVRLLFAELREARLRDGLANLVNRRLVVDEALDRALVGAPRDLTAEGACEAAFQRLRNIFAGLTGGVEGFLANGPVHHRRWEIVSGDLRLIAGGSVPSPGLARGILDRVEVHFLNKDGHPRQRFDRYSAKDCRSADAWRVHRGDVLAIGRDVADALKAFRRDLNVVLSRAVRRLYQIAVKEYRETLDSHGMLDFSETLAQALVLLGQMDEFARSRYRLEGRYHHVLLDEFQDTSRAQWNLVAHLIRSWSEGRGMGEGLPLVPSIFVVGDRKQSIYGFRDADAAILDEAGAFVDGLRPDRDSRRAISKSFRAVPQLLAFANDLFDELDKDTSRRDAFRFDEQDRFPVDLPLPGASTLGMIASATITDCANAVAFEVRRLIDAGEEVRDPDTRVARPIRPRDIAILFRTKDSHQDFEKALQRQQVPSYVYKGLGFFEADEIKDVLALLRFLAVPESNLRAGAFLRSRFVRLSDAALQHLAPDLAFALSGPGVDLEALGQEDRLVLERTRESMRRWLSLVDRLPPAELVEQMLQDTAFLFETRGTRVRQARENLKKIRSMIRRVQNRGYTTMSRLAEHLDRLTAGDESNAVIDAGDSVSLMTIHAAKGLEFPVVFVVNLTRGTGGRKSAIRVVSDARNAQAWMSVSDFQSEADEDARAKDREETKRLLYVALTRARDRLYLAADIKEARFRAFGGSLGDILPATIKSRFEAASTPPQPDVIEWTGKSGQTHTFRVCPAPESVPEPAVQLALGAAAGAASADDDFSMMSDRRALPRMGVTDRSRFPATAAGQPHTRADNTRRMVGTLVHRLFERFGTSLADSMASSSDDRDLVLLLRDSEAVDIEDRDRLMTHARRAYCALCGEPSLREALEAGNALFEVPFSVRLAGSDAVLRGTFDCVVEGPGGRMTVFELKTGRPAAEHQEQLSVYLAAARAMFPGMQVEGQLVYGPSMDDRSFDA